MPRIFNVKLVGNKQIANFLKRTQKQLDIFFSTKIIEPVVFIIASRNDFDIIYGKKTQPWLVGLTRGNTIYILKQSKFLDESNHQPKDFWSTLRHEYAHVYYSQVAKSGYPIWLNEGLACYISGRKNNHQKIEKKNLFNIFIYFDKSDRDVYNISQYWVGRLINKYGHKKLVRLLKSLNVEAKLNKKIFAQKFYEVYGFHFNRRDLRQLMD